MVSSKSLIPPFKIKEGNEWQNAAIYPEMLYLMAKSWIVFPDFRQPVVAMPGVPVPAVTPNSLGKLSGFTDNKSFSFQPRICFKTIYNPEYFQLKKSQRFFKFTTFSILSIKLIPLKSRLELLYLVLNPQKKGPNSKYYEFWQIKEKVSEEATIFSIKRVNIKKKI